MRSGGIHRGVVFTVAAVALSFGSAGCADDGELSDGGPLPRNDYCDPVSDWDAEWEDYEMEVLRLVNKHRADGASCGGDKKPSAKPLAMDASLRCAARAHSADMADRGYFAHDTPDGVSPWDRIAAADYDANATGENIAAGYPDPEAVVDGWMNSPGHCNNIMNQGSNEIGVGYHGDALWTQTFGNRSE